MSDAESLDGMSTVEVRTSATAALIPTIRAVASDLAARADFDLDAISDLRMAVDEACATLVDAADPTSQLQCRFLVRPERIRVHAEVQSAKPDIVLSTDTFGWRVLQTLADHCGSARAMQDRPLQSLSSRYSRSQALMTPMKVSCSVSLMAR